MAEGYPYAAKAVGECAVKKDALQGLARHNQQFAALLRHIDKDVALEGTALPSAAQVLGWDGPAGG